MALDEAALKRLWADANAGDLDAQVGLAAVLQQAELNEQAVHWLQRASGAGHLRATTLLGLHEVAGRGLAADPARGLARVLAAADQQDAEAAHLASILLTAGLGCARDRPAGLRRLLQAARLGHMRAATVAGLLLGPDGPDGEIARGILQRPAAAGHAPAQYALGRSADPQAQDWLGAAAGQQHPLAIKLAALVPAPSSPGVATAAVDWATAESQIDLGWVDALPERRIESSRPLIESLADFLPRWACDYVVGMAAPALARARVVDNEGGESIQGIRTNSVMSFGLGDSDLLLELINLRIAGAAGMPPEQGEGLGVLHYRPGETYLPHYDFIPETAQNAAQLASRGQRVKTLLVYLNDDFAGGETEFVRLGLRLRPPAGTALIFPSITADGQLDPNTLHTGRAPTGGDKWLISKWFRTRPLRPVHPLA